jgi:hypothetical protein
MWWKLMVGVGIGAAAGALVGWRGACAGGGG